jgi:hypothetical protein
MAPCTCALIKTGNGAAVPSWIGEPGKNNPSIRRMEMWERIRSERWNWVVLDLNVIPLPWFLPSAKGFRKLNFLCLLHPPTSKMKSVHETPYRKGNP